MAQSAVYVAGLKEFIGELRALHPRWPQALTAAHRNIAEHGAAYARANAGGRGGVWAKAAPSIQGRATQTEARISIPNGLPGAAFWGMKRHTGWYAKARYRNSPAQHPKWVGSSWEVAVAGQGPYAINDALAQHKEELLDEYLIEIEKLAAAAFPN